MNKKNYAAVAALGVLSIAVGASVTSLFSKGASDAVRVKADPTSYTLTIYFTRTATDDRSFMSSYDTDSKVAIDNGGYYVSFDYDTGTPISDAQGKEEIGRDYYSYYSGGYFRNTTPIHGITSIAVDGSSD
nr:hypothetical protein [Bacilli bacterium]